MAICTWPAPALTPSAEHGTRRSEDYDRAAEFKPADLKLHLDRGACLANLGRWDRAASDYAHGLESKPDDVDIWHEAAMAQLAAGKTNSYARICSRLWDQLGEDVNLEVTQIAGYAAMVAPIADAEFPVAEVEASATGGPAHGAALYRSGKWEEAVRMFEQATATPFRQSCCWLFLAMAHDRLGHAEPSRQFLDKAVKWFEEAEKDQKTNPSWSERVEFQTLRREAEGLLNVNNPSEVSGTH